jgi:DhnA family fructose-bisphosphate aldolase class Ia
VAKRYLSLDQAMIMGALGNVLGRGIMQRAFSKGAIERSIRPVIGLESFSAGG